MHWLFKIKLEAQQALQSPFAIILLPCVCFQAFLLSQSSQQLLLSFLRLRHGEAACALVPKCQAALCCAEAFSFSDNVPLNLIAAGV